MRRHSDWLAQAKKDLKAAKDSCTSKHYEWTCFQAQQAAEKAMKALLLFNNQDVWGHSITQLVLRGKDTFPKLESLVSKARELDRHYIQPRDPNGFVSGHPAEYYDEDVAERCINYATDLLNAVEEHISEISSRK